MGDGTRQVNAIAGRLSLRPPQRRSLEILHRVTEVVPPRKAPDLAAALAAIRAEYPQVTDFEREFPSLCFALATGVGKTRLMGAFISYLHLAHGLNNFFVLAPNLTIYEKLIADFTPNTPKYVFKGIAELAVTTPIVVTGDNYEAGRGVRDLQGWLPGINELCINVFNISKISAEVRGGKEPRIKRLSEYIGQSYFDHLAALPDLVLIMDESHHYRAKAGMRAINELRPVLGLELTATPFVEKGKGTEPFKNVVFDYPLGKAMADGFVKEPAVVTRMDFNAVGEEVERIKLDDAVRLHESVKVELETYARQTDNALVKPFVLVIAKDTTHAGKLLDLIKSDGFFGGAYKDKAIQVDSSQSGEEKEENIARLLRVEHADEPTEIVIHVNMLKEGWDVTNLYTIVPLRPANARTLIEQSIGRGLRLPYGKRTGVAAVDRLSIVAHDHFQEIVDEANKPDSPIRLQQIVLTSDQLAKTVTVVAQPTVLARLGIQQPPARPGVAGPPAAAPPMFAKPEERRASGLVYDSIWRLARQGVADGEKPPTVESLLDERFLVPLAKEAEERYDATRPILPGIVERPDFKAIAARTVAAVVQLTIGIPRITVQPKAAIRSRFERFDLDLTRMQYQPVSGDLWVQYLAKAEREVLSLGPAASEAKRLEDYVVNGLGAFDDVDYDANSEALYDLAAQVVRHLRVRLPKEPEEAIANVLRFHQRQIAELVHVQMQSHYLEDHVEYEVEIKQGFTEIRQPVFTARDGEPHLDYHRPPPEKAAIAQHVFDGFSKCIVTPVKFQSDPERVLAIILEREALKWFRPSKGQFQIYYRWQGDEPEYQPDFAVEAADVFYMLEVKRRAELEAGDVVAKKTAGVLWCQRASAHAAGHGGKTWKYVLIPHDVIAENMTLSGLAARFSQE